MAKLTKLYVMQDTVSGWSQCKKKKRLELFWFLSKYFEETNYLSPVPPTSSYLSVKYSSRHGIKCYASAIRQWISQLVCNIWTSQGKNNPLHIIKVLNTLFKPALTGQASVFDMSLFYISIFLSVSAQKVDIKEEEINLMSFKLCCVITLGII